MKKLLLLFIFAAFIFSMCQKPKSRYDLISQAQYLESIKRIKKDTIVLDFVFGMSRSQVENHFQKLLKEGKISMDKLNQYQYEISLSRMETLKANFYGEFFNDSLYSMSLKIDLDSHQEAVLAQLQLSILYLQKYGSLLQVPAILNDKEQDCIFINGNQQIEIPSPFLSTVSIEYKDYIIESRKNKLEEKNQEIKKIELIKDL